MLIFSNKIDTNNIYLRPGSFVFLFIVFRYSKNPGGGNKNKNGKNKKEARKNPKKYGQIWASLIINFKAVFIIF